MLSGTTSSACTSRELKAALSRSEYTAGPMTRPTGSSMLFDLFFLHLFCVSWPLQGRVHAHLAWPCPAPVHRFLQLAHGGVQRRVVRLIAELQLCSRVEGQPKASACTPDRVMPRCQEKYGRPHQRKLAIHMQSGATLPHSALWPCRVWQGLQQPGAEPEVLWEGATQLWAQQRALHSAPRLRTTNEILHEG